MPGLAKDVRAEEAKRTRFAVDSRASSISTQDSKKRGSSTRTKKPNKRHRPATEDDNDREEEDDDDKDDLDYQSDSSKIKAGIAERSRKEKNKRLAMDNFQCIVCETDSPAVCHIVPFCVNHKEKDLEDWSFWLLWSAVFLGEPSKPVHDELLHQSFAGKTPGVSDRQWNMISLNPQLHTWWGQARWGFKSLGPTTEGPHPDPGHTKLKLQFHWMPRRATNRAISTLGLTLAEFQSAFDGHWGEPYRKPLVCMTYPGSGRFIETGDIFYVVVPTRDCPKMELAFQIQWAVLKMAAMAGGAEALDYLPDRPEHTENGWLYVQMREMMRYPLGAMTVPGLSAQHRASDTEPSSPETSEQ